MGCPRKTLIAEWEFAGDRAASNGGQSLSSLTNERCEPLTNDLHGWADSHETRSFAPLIHDSESLAIAGNNLLARKLPWPARGKFAGSPTDAGGSNK